MVGKEQNGKGFVLCAGHTGSVQQLSEWKAVVHKQGTPVSPPGWLPGLCRQHWLVLLLNHPGKASCTRCLSNFLFFHFKGSFFFNCSVI